jgi:molybdenum cofactor cytidylyltransferase
MISAIILAAGLSKRMGSPKMVLPWGDDTVLGHVVRVFRSAGVEDVIVVSGGARAAVEEIAIRCGSRVVFNPAYASQGMLGSLQAGVAALPATAEAALIALGDQPQIQRRTIQSILDDYTRTGAPLIVPSYKMRRGHPWLLGRPLWKEFLGLHAPETPRDFLNKHSADIAYVVSASPTILQDLDTPEDYLKSEH